MEILALNRKRVFVSCLIVAVIVASLSGCTPAPVHNAVTAISLDKEKVTIEGIGIILQINATISPSNATNQGFSWKSLDTSVATVDRGYIKSVSVGTTMIEAISDDGNKVARCEVTVTQAASTGTGTPASPPAGDTGTPATPTKIVATGVTLNKTSLQLTLSSTQTILVATISPGNAENKGVSWTSSNTAVATVTQDGQVSPLAKGSTTITVTTQEGGLSAQCAVTVSGVAPTGVSLDITSLTLTTADNPVLLEATVLPADAENTNVKWTSSHPLVAHVDQTGKVTPVAKGTTTIRATTEAGNLVAECPVSITAVVPQGVSLDRDSLNLFLGGTVTLTPTILPSAAENKAVQWSSSKPSVATVDSTGKVTAVAEGTATITARTVAGDASTDCDVTVVKLVLAPIAPIIIGPVKATGLSIDRTRLDLVTGGDSSNIVATIEPSNATNKKVIWTSSNTDVATVDSNGKVTPKLVGSAVVTGTTEDGGFKALCPVEVGTPNTVGSTVGNYAAGGSMTFQGNWIYFTIHPGTFEPGKGVYKIRIDGSEHTQLTSDVGVSSIGVVGDWVYYASEKALYRVRTDGTQRTLLNNIDAVGSPQVIGPTIYYLSGGSLYKMSTSGENRAKVSDESYIRRMLVTNYYIFYTKSRFVGSTAPTGLYRMTPDGLASYTVTSDETWKFTVDVNNQRIFYIKADMAVYPKNYLYIITTLGSDKQRIGANKYAWINFAPDFLFYVLHTNPLDAEISGLYRMRKDGTLPMLISSTPKNGESCYVFGDHIYFMVRDALYRVKRDGTGEVKLK